MDVAPAWLPQHREAIHELIEAIGIAEGHPAIGEHKYLALHRPQTGIAGLGGWEDGRLVAFAPLAIDGSGRHVVELVVVSSHRRPAVYSQMLEGVIQLARSERGRALRVWIFHPGIVATAIALGFAEERQLLRLALDLPVRGHPDYPDGIVIRPFRRGEDEKDWIRLNRLAFARHPENGTWGPQELAERMEQAWFSPENLLMAWKENALVGFNWLKPLDQQGEIYVVAVDPAMQKSGLGRALILDGLRRLEELGCEQVCLYVDADNHRALRLYRSLGFFLDNVDQTLLKTL
ncbi:MAG: mycothiol synthase [Acidimicrobiia bacterium]